MPSELIRIITSDEPAVRDTALEAVCRRLSLSELLNECAALDRFRRDERQPVSARACAFLPVRDPPFSSAAVTQGVQTRGRVPFEGYRHLLTRRFEEAIETFLQAQQAEGASDAISSALAAAYHDLGFQTLANQVRRSVRSVRGNQWMFRIGHPADQPLRIRPELLAAVAGDGSFPDSCANGRRCGWTCRTARWSDIFFLGMDFPEGARVLNVSIDLAVRGRDRGPRPPVEAYLRVIDEPVLRLVSVDLGATADITSLPEVFDFAKDYLGCSRRR